MKRFLHIGVEWIVHSEQLLNQRQSYGCESDIAEEEGYDPDEMEESDWDELWSRREYLL